MAELNFPSMFDTRYAIDRQMQEDAMLAGQTLSDPLGAGMMYASHLSGDMYGQGLMGMASMFGGGDPRMQQQNALDEIMARFPDPQTPEDFVEISNALQGAGLHNYAEKARGMANEIRTSMPGPDEIIIKEIKTTDTDGNPVTKTVRFNKTTGQIIEVVSTAPTWQPKDEDTLTPKDENWNIRKSQPDYVKAKASDDNAAMLQIALDFQTEWARTNDPESTPGVDEQIKIAKLENYIAQAETKIRAENANVHTLSEEKIKELAEQQGKLEYNRVESAAANSYEPTSFMKNYDFFMSQTTDNGSPKFTVDEALEKATSLDHKLTSELGQEKQDEEVLKDQVAMKALGEEAWKNLRLTEQLLGLLGGINTGKWDQLQLAAGQWLGMDVASEEMFFSLSTLKVMEYTEMTKGAISDAEMELFRAAAVGMGKTTEGNRMLLQFAKAGSEAQIRMNKYMREWVAKKGVGNFSFNEYWSAQEEFRNSPANKEFFKIVHSQEWKDAEALGKAMESHTKLGEMKKEGGAIWNLCNPNSGSDQGNRLCKISASLF